MFQTTSLDYEKYIKLLSEMISHTEKLQNNPPNLIPQEELIADIVTRELKDCPNISIKRFEYVQKRPNLVIKYENYQNEDHNNINRKSMGFIGSHMDVVPAELSEWDHPPFSLTIDDTDPDILWGRGTTDCLGHVAMLTILLKSLSVNCVKLDYILGVVFIADEENGDDPTIGITHLAADGELDFLKSGPVYWVDSSDIFPTVGSGTGMGWELTVTGKRGHSGIPFNAINPVVFAMSATLGMMEEFNLHFPALPIEKEYKYQCSSNIKPTQLKETTGSINQITSSVTVLGDVRATPFYDWKKIRSTMNNYIDSLNIDPMRLPSFHENFPYKLDDGSRVRFDLKWLKEPYIGVACDMKSIGFKMLSDATMKVHGSMDFTSCCGSLPLISTLNDMGFDMQIIGYGVDKAYHANNEFCKFSWMKEGYDIIKLIICMYSD
jgi:acetylornithine deacetylase